VGGNRASAFRIFNAAAVIALAVEDSVLIALGRGGVQGQTVKIKLGIRYFVF